MCLFRFEHRWCRLQNVRRRISKFDKYDMKTNSNSANFRAENHESIGCVVLIFFVVALCSSAGSAQTLSNGGNQDGIIVANGTNTYTFTANTGDSIVLRCGKLSGIA